MKGQWGHCVVNTDSETLKVIQWQKTGQRRPEGGRKEEEEEQRWRMETLGQQIPTFATLIVFGTYGFYSRYVFHEKTANKWMNK